MSHPTDRQALDSTLLDLEWLRGFARTLIRDADLAEDLGQEVVLAELSNPPPRGVPRRSWLARVARNIAIGFCRRETRRQRAEDAAPAAQHARAAGDVVAEAELQFEAGRAVLDLHEPYRSTLLARFMKGLSCRAIAARTGVPVETVRTRLKRGLALVRAKLDHSYDGRRGWLPPIASPALWKVDTPTLWGFVLMKVKTKALLVTGLVLAGLLGVWYRSGPTAAIPPEPGRSPANPIAADAPVSDVPSPVGDRHILVPAAPPVPAVEVASLLVRVVWQGTQEPAGHVGVSVTRLRATGTGAWYPAAPATLTPTDAAGKALFDALDPGRFDVRTFRQDGDAVEARAGERTTVELAIPRGLSIRGIVVDRDDLPVAGAEILCVASLSPPQSAYPLTVTAGDGSFRVDSPSRGNLIGARTRNHGTSDFALLDEFVPDSRGDVILRLTLPGLPAAMTGRVSDPRGNPVANAWVTIGGRGSRERRRVLPGGGTFHAPPTVHVATDAQGEFRATSLRSGPTALYVYARGYSRWRGTAVCPPGGATHVSVQLQSGAALFGRITNRDGEPVQDAYVLRPANYAETGVAMTTADGRYRFDDLPAGELTLSIHSPQHGSMEPTILLTSGRPHEVDFRLDAGLRIEGELVDHRGQPLENWVIAERGTAGAFARADRGGAFVLNNCEAREYTLEVYPPSFVGPAVRTVQHVLPGAAELTIEVPREALPSARITGRVLMPDGNSAAKVSLQLANHPYPMVPPPETDARGRFEVGPLPAGRYEIRGSLAGFLDAQLGELSLVAGEVRQVPDARLRYGARLVVAIQPANHTQLEDLEVQVVDAAGITVDTGQREGQSVSFRLLPTGLHSLVVRGPNIETQRLAIELKAGETLALEVALP